MIFQMLGKSSITLLTILGIARNIGVQYSRASNNFTGMHSVAYVTVPTQEFAKQLAQDIVKSKLAACVNIIPQITSVYEWKNEINEDNELLLMIKTRTEVVPALTEFVKSKHPYEVCEVISLPIENGNQQYLNWISEVVPPIEKSRDP